MITAKLDGAARAERLECLPGAAPVVAADAVELGLGAIDQDERLSVLPGQLDQARRGRPGQKDGRLGPVAEELPAGVGDVVAGRSDVDDRRHVAALDQGAGEGGNHLGAERRLGVGRHQPDDPAAIGEQAASEIVDLVAEGGGRLLHPRQRRRRDAGAGREGAGDRRSRDAGALARRPAR